MIKIAVQNKSTVMKDADVESIFGAIQKQVSNDFAPVWGVDAAITFFIAGNNPPAGSWNITVFDDADQAGALGYHDITPDGLPLGKVFARTTQQDNSSVSVCASHETLEMLADPDINLCAERDNTSTGAPLALYAYEVGDPVEADNFGYNVTGADNTTWVLSDFVYPAWFEGFRPSGSTQFDRTRAVNGPFVLAAGGYISVMQLQHRSGWQEITADAAMDTMRRSRPHIGSRRERRHTPRSRWMRSNYKMMR